MFTSLMVNAADLGPAKLIKLGPDADPGETEVDPTANGALHWAPHQSKLLRDRSAILIEAFRCLELSLLVVDVSVEVSLLARLCGVPVVTVRSHGDRSDRAHRLGYDVSHRLFAPFPEELECPNTPIDIRKRTFYSGFVTAGRPSQTATGLQEMRCELGLSPEAKLLVVCVGGGGHSLNVKELQQAGESLADWTIAVVGVESSGSDSSNVLCLGWREDVSSLMSAATVVACHGGANLVAEAASVGRPLICVAEDRPFDEQLSRVRRLGELGAAVSLDSWPSVEEWSKTLEEALDLGAQTLRTLASATGASAAASWLDAVHDRLQ